MSSFLCSLLGNAFFSVFCTNADSQNHEIERKRIFELTNKRIFYNDVCWFWCWLMFVYRVILLYVLSINTNSWIFSEIFFLVISADEKTPILVNHLLFVRSLCATVSLTIIYMFSGSFFVPGHLCLVQRMWFFSSAMWINLKYTVWRWHTESCKYRKTITKCIATCIYWISWLS